MSVESRVVYHMVIEKNYKIGDQPGNFRYRATLTFPDGSAEEVKGETLIGTRWGARRRARLHYTRKPRIVWEEVGA